MEVSDELIAEEIAAYPGKVPELLALSRKAVRAIDDAIRNSGISGVLVTSRVKEPDSFEQKLRKAPDRLVEDVVGIRIITRFRADIDWIASTLHDALRVKEGTFVDKAALLDAESFGYRSVQFVAELPLVVPEDFDGPAWLYESMHSHGYVGAAAGLFEIQIRTILEHGWSEVDHVLRYKRTEILSPVQERRFAATAAMLESADELFDLIRDEAAAPPGVPIASSRMSFEPPDESVERFTDTDKLSRDLDARIAMALGIPKGRPEKCLREVERAAGFAGLTDSSSRRSAIREHGELALRMAVVCSDVSHALLIPDSPAYFDAPAVAFPGIGLYWLGLSLGNPRRVPVLGVESERLHEYQQACTYLQAHPAEPTLSVRDRFQRLSSPAGDPQGVGIDLEPSTF